MYDECVQIFVVTVYLECVPLAGLAWLGLAGGRRGTRGEARRGAGGDRQEGPTMANQVGTVHLSPCLSHPH